MPLGSHRPADVPKDSSPDGTADTPRDASFLPGATCSIGRAHYHDVVVNSPHICEDHAVLHNHAHHGLLIIDLYSEAGTFVAGDRLPVLQPRPLRALSDLAIPIYGISTGEAEVADLVKRVAEVLRTKTDFPNELRRLFIPPHPFGYDPSSNTTAPSPAMQWRPVTATPQTKPFCMPPPSPSTPPRSTRRFSPLPTRGQRTTRVSGPPPASSRMFQHASPGRIFNHPYTARSPGFANKRVPSPLRTPWGLPAAATRASPLGKPRTSPLGTPPASPFAPRTNVRTGGAYLDLTHETPPTREVPLSRTQASTPNVPRTPHPQDADTMPTHSPFPRPILKTNTTKRTAANDGSSRPRKRARTSADDADSFVRRMPGAWPYESRSGNGRLRDETMKERVEKEMGGRSRVRFGEPGVWVGA